MASLRVLSCNAFLIPGWFVNSANASCRDQAARAGALGTLAEAFDVALLQEVWGSSNAQLEAGLLQSHTAVDKSWGSTVMDSVWQGLRRFGGLYCSYKAQRASLRACKRHTFSESVSKSGKGVQGLLLDVAADSERKNSEERAVRNPTEKQSDTLSLAIFNTHLDPRVQGHRIVPQAAELLEFMETCLREWDTEPSRTVVVLAGDLNSSRKQCVKLFPGGRDGDGECRDEPTYDPPKNPYAMWLDDRGDLDHFLVFGEIGGRRFADVQVSDFKVHSDVIVSDHYPITCTLKWGG
uniref:Endonuclease/exonuclease/phosphatase domain-containing protein n=1 Tax=Chromera velia CCMP2878 TaxID=1169474 RepID=A0A0G4HN88_9ALVE|mmetsp:Transcript_34828/g.68756  ORF Transcript_34828/g.68756 Transcript_34828/m.68756 type:complete len:294 (+) Transcript_34828:209-1090(+)|eukprot:Cvel_7584.t1-p1 / transcript=Cvel_7584.t1 / gene=Cvel_7584 / organism=Chromera_velia_CCMP2878 / gene_product=hypothetical protein / transcript_product=hypothetical protein / location=Cvel_scaffold399:52468-53346(-) / protein_length=293 / sequence_SO=supercontig / SO=protein_coding / is_pseudo=false